MTMPILMCTILRISLGTILLLAGISKLGNFNSFVINVSGYQLLPIELLKPMCYLIVSAEITLGIGLCVGYFSHGAAILSLILFLVFAIALINVLLRKLFVIDCSCANYLFSLFDRLGFSNTMTPNWMMVFTDIILAGISFGLAYSTERGYGLDRLIKSKSNH